MSAPSRGCSSVGVSTLCRWQLMLSPQTYDSGAQLLGRPVNRTSECYAHFSKRPQVNDVMTLNPCTFDSTTRPLTVSNGPITATSNPAIARFVNATASDLNNKTFLFTSGEIFNAALVNIVVTLQFTNNANSFTL